MLQTISWKEYLMTVGLVLAVYYGWWVLRYYPGLRKGRDRGRGLDGGREADRVRGGDRGADRAGDG